MINLVRYDCSVITDSVRAGIVNKVDEMPLHILSPVPHYSIIIFIFITRY